MDIKKYELSTPQKSIWLTEQIYNGTNIGTISGTLFIDENINIDLLKETIKIFINKNDSMRTRIIVEEGNPKQFINAVDNPEIEVLNLNNELELKKLENEVSSHVFNLINSELYIFKIFKLQNGNGGIVSNLHHLIADAWSFGIMSKQLKDIYEKLLLNEDFSENNPSYTDYIENEKNYYASEKYIKDKDYWQNRFLNVPELSCIKPYNNENASTNANRYKASLDINLCEKINKYAKENNTSAYSFLMSIYSIYLSRVSGLDSVIIGTPFLNRSNFKEKNTMGMFVNTLPNRLDIDWNLKFSEYVKYTTEEQKNMFRHSKYPYNELLEKVRKDQSITRNLYDIAMSYQNARNDSQISNINYHTYWNFCGKITESMEIHVFDMDNTGSLQLLYDYQTVKFSEEEIKDIHSRILHIINQVLDNEKLLKDIEIVTPEEKQKLLYEFNNTKSEYPRDKTIAQVFEKQVELYPEKLAIVFETESLTYKEFNEKSNKLAKYLSANGVNAKDNVVILAEKSIDLYVSIMAILKLGALYVPVDNEYPEDRIKLILDDCKPKVVIVDKKSADLVKNQKICTIPLQGLEDFDGSNLENKITAEDGAYIIYTSGSTGKPKGVMVPHRGVVRLVKNTNYIEFKETDRILQNIPVVFDASTFAIFGSFLNGLTLYPIQKHKLLDFEYLEKFIKENKINIINSTVSFFNKLIEYNPKIFDECRSVLIGGEEVLPKTVNIFRENNPQSEIVNVYGPTENSNLSSCHIIRKEYKKSVPIGIPVSNSTCYILDKHQNLLPIGIPGEIYVGGDGVALGYLNNPELTNEKFIPNIFGEGKLYKTGDLGYWENEGVIQFMSRIDNQVKIRGFRIELKEIETKILEFGHMKECAVIIADNNKTKMLVGCIGTSEQIDVKELNAYLKAKLPSYMVPSKYIVVDSLPLNINGKLDAKKLLKELENQKDEIIPARNETDKIIIDSLCELLSISNISITDSVFDLGADSLSAISFSNTLTKKCEVAITVQDIFNYPIIEELSNYIQTLSNKNTKSIIKVADKMPYYPISNAQKRIYYSSIIDSNSTVYNTAGGIIIDKVLDTKKLEECFKTLIKRHDALRTYFKIIDNEVVQFITDEVSFSLDIENATSSDINKIYMEFVKPFNLEKAPLIRAKAVILDNNKILLLLDMHHIISDGTSLGILLQELCDLYNNKVLPEKKLDYKDFTLWEKEQFETEEFKKAKDFWVNQFKDEIPLLNMPYTFSRPSIQSFEGSNYHTKISNDIFNKINETAKKLNITPYMLMLSTYYILLSKYTSQDDIVIGTAVVGREISELSNMLGMFVNTLALRNTVNHSLNFNDFTNSIKEYCLSAFKYENYPFDELVKELNIKKDTCRNPLFDVAFIYQNNGYPKIELENVNIEYFIPDNNISKFDLSLEVIPVNNEYSLRFEYCTKLFNEDFIKQLSSHYINILLNILNNPEIKISDIDMLSPEERYKILYEFNDTKIDYPKDKTIVQLFEEQVEKTPDNIAVVFENEKLTYRELNEKANAIAMDLLNNNVNKGDAVGVLLPRSIELIISIFAILKCNAIYMPLFSGYPNDRLNYMLENSNCKLVITNNNLKNSIERVPNILLEDFNKIINKTIFKTQYGLPNNIAYIIYTSGSTGKPKGVQITNKNLNNFIYSFNKYFNNIGSEDNFLSSTNISFDVSIFEIFLPLLNGSSLVLYHEDIIKDILDYCDCIIKNNITALYIPPNILNQVYSILKDRSNIKINKLLVGVEAIKKQTLNKYFLLNPNMCIINGYGPTETTICCTALHYTKDLDISTEIVPIGKPLCNDNIYILDSNKKPQPINVSGELYITGDGVGAGYINNSDETDKNYVKNIYDKSSDNMYKTGDIGKWNSDGTITLIGRKDNQIKISGYRVELREIDSVIMNYPNIDKSITIVANIEDKKRLISYFVSPEQILNTDLLSYLNKKLPFYMIPDKIIQLESFPITSNGKIDEKALPIPNLSALRKTAYVAPTNKLEMEIINIFERVLSTSPIGIDDNFFELGGDSLLAINLQIELLKENLNITYSDIYMNPTVRDLEKYISSTDKNTFSTIDKNEFLPFDNILNNTCNMPNILKQKNIGNILISGTTGFLGAHVLDKFLKNEKGIAYCLIRPEPGLTLEKKLLKKLHFYFGEKYDKFIGSRIIIVNANITKPKLGLTEEDELLLSKEISCVINCAAKVSHFGNYNIFKEVNVDGTENLLKFSKEYNKRFYHISTLSISGNSLIEQSYIEQNFESDIDFKENNFYINQSLDNVYVRSKFEAEKLVLQYINQGLDAYILRVGNLMNRLEDGKFQPNILENAYISRLISFAKIGCIPDYLSSGYMEFTPVDECSEAIIRLIQYPNKENRVFHLYNNNHVDITDFIDILKNYINFNIVSDTKFINKINIILKQENSDKILSGILRDFDMNKKLIYDSKIKIKSDFTIEYLKKCKFKWSKIDKKYLANFLNYFIELGYFKRKDEK